MPDQPNEKQLRILQGTPVPPDKHGHEQHVRGAEDQAEQTEVREHRLDLAGVREKLKAKTGKQFWRTLEELTEDPHFDELLHREFPMHASEWDQTVERRDFLKLMGASLALAGLAGAHSSVRQTAGRDGSGEALFLCDCDALWRGCCGCAGRKP
jgi:MoCo/4Fe-4S cofactor protein with predicted Tat translocation signal